MKFLRYVMLTLALLITCNINLHSNNNYKAGYIIKLNNDTISGFLLCQNSIDASKQCVFKENLNADKKTYSAMEISGYRFSDGKYYVSRKLKTQAKPEMKSVFMEFFIKGIISLYYYVDYSGEHYYIEKFPYGLRELSEPERILNGRIVQPKYTGKLISLMADYPGIENEVNNAELNYTSLVGLARKYHNFICNNDSCVIFERKATPVKVNIGFIAGISCNKYRFGKAFITDFRPGYQFGATINIYNAVFSNDDLMQISIILEGDSRYIIKAVDKQELLTYNNETYNINNRNASSAAIQISVSELPVNLKLSELKIPFILNHKFEIGKTTLSAGAGVTNKIILSSNKDFKAMFFEEQYGKTFRVFYTGITGRAGLERKILKKSISFSLVYEYIFDPAAVNLFSRLIENNYVFQLGFMF